MARKVAIGVQNFETLRMRNCFYVDKTQMIKEWWENEDDVTLITRPRRFGKTLNLSMLECFFSKEYIEKGEKLFDGLCIWQEEKYRNLQGTYPVISLSFAGIKDTKAFDVKMRIRQLIGELYQKNSFLLRSSKLDADEKQYIEKIKNIFTELPEYFLADTIRRLSEFLYKEYGKKTLILLDEYDTPMQEAYINGYWGELVELYRNLFNATFKNNPYMERAMMTGITRVSKESVFSDLNHLKVITTTSEEYADCFGFTEKEVFDSMDEMQFSDKKKEVKQWYDGFTFGNLKDIYNPWSIINFLREKGKFGCYWANTSSNQLVDKLVREGSVEVKQTMEDLLYGKTLLTELDEQVIFDQLLTKKNAIWSLFLASGYLKVKERVWDEFRGCFHYELALTNREVKMMFQNLIEDWFSDEVCPYNAFLRALLAGNLRYINAYMNDIALHTFSFFDSGQNPSKKTEPERFYHGFVLGLLVDLRGRYAVTSNRESGFGRYDVLLEPLKEKDPAIIIEFKVHDSEAEIDLQETVEAALTQIEEKHYEALLLEKGVSKDRIHKYGFAFEGKTVLIGGK